jgi:hypothetical protein
LFTSLRWHVNLSGSSRQPDSPRQPDEAGC